MGGAARVEQLKVTENLASIDGKQRGMKVILQFAFYFPFSSGARSAG